MIGESVEKRRQCVCARANRPIKQIQWQWPSSHTQTLAFSAFALHTLALNTLKQRHVTHVQKFTRTSRNSSKELNGNSRPAECSLRNGKIGNLTFFLEISYYFCMDFAFFKRCSSDSRKYLKDEFGLFRSHPSAFFTTFSQFVRTLMEIFKSVESDDV